MINGGTPRLVAKAPDASTKRLALQARTQSPNAINAIDTRNGKSLYTIFANGAKNSRTAKVAIECALQLRNKTLLRKTQPRNRQAELAYLMNTNNQLLHAPCIRVGISVVDRRLEELLFSLRLRLVPRPRIAADLHDPELKLLLVPVYGT